MVSTLATAVDGEICLLDSDLMVSKPRPNSCSKCLIIGIYPAASVFKYPHLPSVEIIHIPLQAQRGRVKQFYVCTAIAEPLIDIGLHIYICVLNAHNDNSENSNFTILRNISLLIGWPLHPATDFPILKLRKWNRQLFFLLMENIAMLPRCLSDFRAIRSIQHPISRLRDFKRFGGKTSYRFVNRGPGSRFDLAKIRTREIVK